MLSLKLPQLQNLIKRDSKAYKDEFNIQRKHFDSEMEIFKLRPTRDSDRFTELLTFMSHTAPCYKEDCSYIPIQLMDLLETSGPVLHPDVRAKLFQGLIILRNKSMIDPITMITLCFKLFNIADKEFRHSLYNYIIFDIKAVNQKRSDDKLNKRIQALLFNIVSTDKSFAAQKSVEILSELYRKKIWIDERTVNVLGLACMSSESKIMTMAINFFLGIESKILEDEEADKKVDLKDVNYYEHNKKTKSRHRKVKRQLVKNEKLKKKGDDDQEAHPLFPAIQLLNDPQSIADNLLSKLRNSSEKFEVKLLVMNFISRLIGCHKLIMLNFYSFMQKYLTSHQKNVTQILTYVIQGTHDLVPPEEMVPIVKVIANNFITERCGEEVLTVGINSIREIIARLPALLHESYLEILVQDISMYVHKMHKIVVAAARSVINLVRELYPALLKKSDRGKGHDINAVPLQYGQEKVYESIPGIELLQEYEANNGDREKMLGSDDGEWEEEEVDEDDNESGDDAEEDEDEEDEDDNESDDDVEDEQEDDDGDSEDSNEEFSDSEGWEDVKESDDESNMDNKKRKFNSINSKPAHSRILSQEDFDLIKRLKATQQKAKNEILHLDKDESDDEENITPSYALEPTSLEPKRKVYKSTKIERLKRILEGRSDSKFESTHGGGLTNKEKERRKNFVMVRRGKREVSKKVQRSSQEVRYAKNTHKAQFGRDKRKRRRI